MISGFFIADDCFTGNAQSTPQGGPVQTSERLSRVQAQEHKIVFLEGEVASLKSDFAALKASVEVKEKELDRMIRKVDGRGQVLDANIQYICRYTEGLSRSIWTLQEQVEKIEEVISPMHAKVGKKSST